MQLDCSYPPDICPESTAEIVCKLISNETFSHVCVRAMDNCCYNLSSGVITLGSNETCQFTLNSDAITNTVLNFTFHGSIPEGSARVNISIPATDGHIVSSEAGTIKSTKGKTNCVHTLYLCICHGTRVRVLHRTD